MKTIIIIYSFMVLVNIYPQEKAFTIDTTVEFDLFSIEDRAAGVHNAGNVGLFFENRGKLYPRRITQGPSGEFPLNSGRNYIFKINPIVGKPGNVIQGRYTINEEWEAVGGYHNPALHKIAFSDDPSTWHPVNGWPVKDSNGDPIFISDQDSYCVYSDSNNSVSLLDIFIHQTGCAFADDSTEDIIFFKFQIINNSQTEYTVISMLAMSVEVHQSMLMTGLALIKKIILSASLMMVILRNGLIQQQVILELYFSKHHRQQNYNPELQIFTTIYMMTM